MFDDRSTKRGGDCCLTTNVRSRFSCRCLLLVAILLLVLNLCFHVYYSDSLPPGMDFCKLLPQDFDSSKVPNGSWWQYICLFERYFDQPLEHDCIDSRMMGNWKVCFDETSAPRKSCLVYSFGIANDFSFDDAMEAEGCTVYSFDPSMGVDDHKHGLNVYFKNLGLGSQDMDNFSPRTDEYVSISQKWKIRTLKSILIMLRHEKRFIDVLKFDVEGYEWEIMLNIMKDGLLPQIGQILTEWHIFADLPPRESLHTSFNTVTSLKQNGLKLFHKKSFYRVHRNRFFNSQCDAGYVNTASDRNKFQ